MKDKQKIYLDKVVEFLVKGTKIDHDKRGIQYPYLSHLSPPHKPSYRELSLILPPNIFYLTQFISKSFSKYCKNVYGLTEDEIKYIWGEFITIIKEKVENGK